MQCFHWPNTTTCCKNSVVLVLCLSGMSFSLMAAQINTSIRASKRKTKTDPCTYACVKAAFRWNKNYCVCVLRCVASENQALSTSRNWSASIAPNRFLSGEMANRPKVCIGETVCAGCIPLNPWKEEVIIYINMAPIKNAENFYWLKSCFEFHWKFLQVPLTSHQLMAKKLLLRFKF